MLHRIRNSIKTFPKATLFELRDLGYDSVFEQLIACVISIRTYDEISLPCSIKLFKKARNPQKMIRLTPEQIDSLISPCTFHTQKSFTIKHIAEQTIEKFGGNLPDNDDDLQSLKGVGPKCAHLTLGIAKNLPYIGVDIHVHRITNRWGYISEKTAENTMRALEGKLPKKHWVEINELLVPFGKHICTARRPFCTTCPVAKECLRVGVKEFR